MSLSALIVNVAVGTFEKINLDLKNERIAFCTVIFPLCVKRFVSNQQIGRFFYANHLHEKRKTHLCVKAPIRFICVKPSAGSKTTNCGKRLSERTGI